MTFPTLITYRAIVRMINHEKFDYACPKLPDVIILN
jgi:hypothetical protein